MVIDRGRKLQYLFEGVFQDVLPFKIMLTINININSIHFWQKQQSYTNVIKIELKLYNN